MKKQWAAVLILRLAGVSMYAACGFTLVLVLFVLTNVFTRPLGFAVYTAAELSGSAFALSVAFAVPWVCLHRTHLRADFLIEYLPSRVRFWLDKLFDLLMLLYLLTLAWLVFGLSSDSFSHHVAMPGVMRFPLAFPQLLVLVSLCLCCVAQLGVVANVGTGPSNGQQ